MSPDRRNFIQSMPYESAMRVSGNAVNPDVTKRFAYTFNHQNYDAAQKNRLGHRLQWLHGDNERDEQPPAIEDRRRIPYDAYSERYGHDAGRPRRGTPSRRDRDDRSDDRGSRRSERTYNVREERQRYEEERVRERDDRRSSRGRNDDRDRRSPRAGRESRR